MDRIVLHVYYTGANGAARSFVEEMQSSGLQAAVKAESGCLQYDYFFSANDAKTVLLLESWQDDAALKAHGASDNMAEIKRRKASFGLDTRIERYE